MCLAVSIDNGSFADVLSDEFLTLLPSAGLLNGENAVTSVASIRPRIGELDTISDRKRREAILELEASNELLVQRQLASLESYHGNRERRVNSELASATDPRIARMKRSELARIETDFERRRVALERARHVDVVSQRVAMGIVEVSGAH
jgi:hypothetical protein